MPPFKITFCYGTEDYRLAFTTTQRERQDAQRRRSISVHCCAVELPFATMLSQSRVASARNRACSVS